MHEERIQKIIATRGYGSRRAVEKLILQGRVKVEGVVVKELGFKAPLNAHIEIDHQEVLGQNQKYYYLFNKPRGVLTTMYDPKKRRVVADYFKNVPVRVYPVGRLDYDVAGLLIMTNDGEFANFVAHPRYEFQKTYQALCQGLVTKGQIKMLIKGVEIDDNYFTQAKQATLLKTDPEKNESVVELTVAEGHKHHVKKMLAAAQINLDRLKRTKIEFLTDAGLKPGTYRELTPKEVKQMYGLYQQNKNVTKKKG